MDGVKNRTKLVREQKKYKKIRREKRETQGIRMLKGRTLREKQITSCKM